MSAGGPCPTLFPPKHSIPPPLTTSISQIFFAGVPANSPLSGDAAREQIMQFFSSHWFFSQMPSNNRILPRQSTRGLKGNSPINYRDKALSLVKFLYICQVICYCGTIFRPLPLSLNSRASCRHMPEPGAMCQPEPAAAGVVTVNRGLCRW